MHFGLRAELNEAGICNALRWRASLLVQSLQRGLRFSNICGRFSQSLLRLFGYLLSRICSFGYLLSRIRSGYLLICSRRFWLIGRDRSRLRDWPRSFSRQITHLVDDGVVILIRFADGAIRMRHKP